MKKLKYTLYTILSLLAIFLILAYFAPGKTDYSKSITIQAPKSTVWNLVNSAEAMDKWSPWNRKDPNMKKTFTGTSGAPGSSMCWESKNDDVGSGCRKIISIEQNNSVNTLITFTEPFESSATSSLILKSINEQQTEATWTFHNESPYPWRIFNLFMDMAKMLDPDFTEGLNNLKSLAEQAK